MAITTRWSEARPGSHERSTQVETVRKEVSNIRWYHRIDLGNGVITPGRDDSAWRLRRLGMPDDLSGLSVLDIGAWDGFFSFAAERRGARRVLAVDSYCWRGGGWGTKAGFDLARRILGSRVEDMEIDVMDLSPQTVGVFDVVLFLGVLYHLRHPLLALERVHSVTGSRLILETHVDMLWNRKPVMAFYPGAELGGDPTSWWGPNPASVVAMLETVGFREVKVIGQYQSFPYRAAKAAWMRIRQGQSFVRTIRQGRLVVHAWR